MKFIVQEPQEDQSFSLVYRPEDYSFDIETLDGKRFTSIMGLIPKTCSGGLGM